MENEQDQQSVVEQQTDDQAKPDTEVADARDEGNDLDKLLNEFSEQTQPITDSTPEPKAVDNDTENRLAGMERTLQEWQFQQEMQPVVEKVRGEIPEDVFSNDEIIDWLDGQAKRDQRLRDAWLNKGTNPGKWNKIVTQLGGELAKKFEKLPDKEATEDREAVANAVRGSQSKAPEGGEDPKYGKMTNQEFAKDVEDKYGFNPGI